METAYRIIGQMVVWCASGAVLAVGLAWMVLRLWAILPKTLTRRIKNAVTWVRVFALGKQWHISVEAARVLLSFYQPRRANILDEWERDIIAKSLRYSRRIGWKELY